MPLSAPRVVPRARTQSPSMYVSMGHVVVLLGHHVHVGLEDDGGSVLVAGRGTLAHGHVANLVGAGLQVVLGGEVEQEFADLFLVGRGARHLGDGVEALPDKRRLKVFYFHCIRCVVSVVAFMAGPGAARYACKFSK